MTAIARRITYRDGAVSLDALSSLRAACDFSVQSHETLEQQMSGARWVVSAWDDADQSLIGFARAISDGATNAYVSSVMVHPNYRRGGIARTLIMRMIDDRHHIRWVLHARKDAMAFYEAIGFSAAPDMMWRDRVVR